MIFTTSKLDFIKILMLSSLIFICSCNGCTARLILASPMTIKVIQFVGKAGQVIKDSTIGYITEKVIDEIIAWINGDGSTEEVEQTNSGIEVIPFSNNPLKGYAKNNYSIKIKGNREGRESSTSVYIKSTHLVFERLSQSSGWVLTMDSQRLINTFSKNGCAQLSLRDLGYDPKGVDGIIGKNTIKAIKDFQNDYGLDLSGKLDKETMAYLLGDGFLINN